MHAAIIMYYSIVIDSYVVLDYEIEERKDLIIAYIKKFLILRHRFHYAGRSESIQPSRTKPKAYGPSEKRDQSFLTLLQERTH